MAFFPEACRSVFPIFLSVSGSWPPTSCLVWSQSRLNAALVRSHAESFSWFHQFGFLYWFMLLFCFWLTGRFSAFQSHDNFLETFTKTSSHLEMNRLASCKGSSLILISFAGLARGVNTP